MRGEEADVDVLIWFAVYLVLIAALAIWREHHDARAKRHRRAAGRLGGESPERRRPTVRALRGLVTHTHRTT